MTSVLNRKTALQWVIWLAYFVLVYALYSARLDTVDAIIMACIILALHYGLFHLNYNYLMPGYFFKDKRVWYFVIIILAIIVVVTLGKMVIDYFYELEFAKHTETRGKPRFSKGVSTRIVIFFRLLPIFFPAVTVVLISSILKYSEVVTIKEKEMTQLQAANLSSELKMLRSQVNPHFLFNALNNMYSMAIDNAENTADVILKFSNMMRYMIYESNIEKVPLNKEIDFLKSYIDIQKLKDDREQNIIFNYRESNLQIAPMLLLPFVENAFKHSKILDQDEGKIELSLSTKGETAKFTVYNTKPTIPIQKDETGGIGIQNVKKRLELLYPQKHKLDFSEDDLKYEVNLEIDLS